MSQSPFARKANNQETGDFELPPAGLHPAYCVGLIDLGTHENEYHGEKKPDKRVLFIAWELAGTETNGGGPFVVGQEYTDSLGKKANWRKMIEGWRGKPFQPDELFDPINLLGVKCVVNLSIGMTKDEKQFSDVTSVSMPMKGQAFPEIHHTPYFWHFAVWEDATKDPDIPDWMPRVYGKTLLSKIKQAKEWLALEAKDKTIPQSKPQSNGSPAGRHPAPAETAAAMKEQEVEPCPF
jgi:hypothetical protein